MKYRKLGTTGLDVSPIAIGAMQYGDPKRGHPVWSLDEETSRPLIKHALDAGTNFFDTANLYSNGSSEEILGRALKDFANRDEVVIATKLRHPVGTGPNQKGLSRKHIMQEVEHQLERLQTNYIDLLQIHRNDHTTPWEETLEALNDLVKSGKVRYIGASSMFAWEFAKALNIQKQHGWARFSTMQDHYNLLAREEEREMIPLCVDEGVGTLIWSPLARGRLARGWDEAKSTSRSSTDGDYADLLYSPTEEESNHAIIDAVGVIAKARGVSRATIALAWLHAQPVVTASLVGAGSIEQIDDAIASLDIELTDDEIQSLIAPYTPRWDFQGVSDEATMDAIRARVPGMKL
jgi:aryl-alcohol dehydrogenase-like predicted oxidoreductase